MWLNKQKKLNWKSFENYKETRDGSRLFWTVLYIVLVKTMGPNGWWIWLTKPLETAWEALVNRFYILYILSRSKLVFVCARLCVNIYIYYFFAQNSDFYVYKVWAC